MVGAIVGTSRLPLRPRCVLPGRISNLIPSTLDSHAARCSGGAQSVINDAQNRRGIPAGLLRYHCPVSLPHPERADQR